jgi:superfamily II DNA or RNA helicase
VIKLHQYQEEALRFWFSSGSKGVIVLPPGSGKTIIAMEAMERLQEPTLIVVPTLPLLDQWVNRLEEFFGIEVGVLGGGKKEIKGVTVSTYDSAYLRAEELGNKFLLAIFDECHHLAAEGYSQIGEMLASEHRMGLTATFEREDGAHVRLLSLIGGVVYKMKPTELAGEHLADFEVVKIPVKLKQEEREQYENLMSEYKKSLAKAGIRLERLEDFKKLVMRSGISEDARKALIARNKARKIAINSASKLEALEEILKAHKWDKVLIFTEYNEMAHIIGQRFLIPVLTHRTSPAEREDILEGFRTGRYTKVVTSKVLDEGLDVPDARIAVVLGGSGSRREFIQRLGRILRKKEKRAILYEVVTSGTIEVSASYRRRRALKE